MVVQYIAVNENCFVSADLQFALVGLPINIRFRLIMQETVREQRIKVHILSRCIGLYLFSL